ncbi:hypothetical protein HG531_007764 [Fusarium graminearum]|nr:hypothetical protein HG531_007764 [Fusarium graminearum]
MVFRAVTVLPANSSSRAAAIQPKAFEGCFVFIEARQIALWIDTGRGAWSNRIATSLFQSGLKHFVASCSDLGKVGHGAICCIAAAGTRCHVLVHNSCSHLTRIARCRKSAVRDSIHSLPQCLLATPVLSCQISDFWKVRPFVVCNGGKCSLQVGKLLLNLGVVSFVFVLLGLLARFSLLFSSVHSLIYPFPNLVGFLIVLVVDAAGKESDFVIGILVSFFIVVSFILLLVFALLVWRKTKLSSSFRERFLNLILTGAVSSGTKIGSCRKTCRATTKTSDVVLGRCLVEKVASPGHVDGEPAVMEL